VKRPWLSVFDVMFVPDTVTLIEDPVACALNPPASDIVDTVDATPPAPATVPEMTAPLDLGPAEGPIGDNDASAPQPAAMSPVMSVSVSAETLKLDNMDRSSWGEVTARGYRKGCSQPAVAVYLVSSQSVSRETGLAKRASQGVKMFVV
jgi:hypothetical protein